MSLLKRWLCSMVAALALITTVHALEDAPENAAHAAILVHMDTGSVLYEKNADERLLIASTTKIMTALVALENADPAERVTVTKAHCGAEGSSIYLRPGETCTVEALLYGLLLASGNDAALALAEHVGGSVDDFVALMNEYALQLGMRDTHFANPHGLDAEDHFSTAADLAVLTREAMRNETFARIVASHEYLFADRVLVNHNKLLWRLDGCTGVKTGYTKAAGRCLVSCAERNGLRLICVTLSDGQDWADHTALMEWGFANWQYRQSFEGNVAASVPVVSGRADAVGVVTAVPSRLLVPASAGLQIRLELPRFVYAEVRAGEHAGTLTVYVDGEARLREELVFAETVASAEEMRLTPIERIRRGLEYSIRYGTADPIGLVYAPNHG